MFSSLKATHVLITAMVINLTTISAALGETSPSIPTQGFQLPIDVVATLSYPSNSQRFFEEGRAKFEQEIQQLLVSDESDTSLLTLQPEVLEQFKEQ